MINKKGQVTIFIIIAIVLVGAVISFFILRESLVLKGIPASIEPIYTSFLSCLEDDTLIGIDILESQAGYISLPDFEPGSTYMPFSSQLDFLGNPIPYWYYVSGNNIQKEQVPSKEDMEEQLGEFIEEEITACVLDRYYDQGFEISQGEPKAKAIIRNNEVEVNLDMSLGINKEEDSALVRNHKIIVKSGLGMLYDSAKKIYEQEQRNLFLENYAVDILYNYAPVDGVELTCSPKIWGADEVFDELQEAIEANTLALNVKNEKYFVLDIPIDADVRFINSKDWPNNFEVAPSGIGEGDSESNVLIANPVGNQPGLGVLGFCYVPYHFVYNIGYPVLIQVYSGEEIFQFPVAVVVKGNKPREALDASAVEIETPDLCKYKNTLVEVNTYDMRLNLVEADISYECFGTTCNIGKTSLEDPLNEQFPQCFNGYILAKAVGFEDAKELYSTTESGSVDIFLDKLYEMNVELKLDGKDYNQDAIISFISDKSSKTIVYPEQRTVKLSEAQYEVQVYIYKNSSLNLEATTYEQCIEVPKSGLGGLFGLTKEKCFEVKIPAQIISNALSGGGKENYYILESELESTNTIEINAQSLPLPKSIEELQDNYMFFEERGLDIYFK
ncbi:hypothetical protein ES703_80533 [subsurface metagenome]